MSRPEDFTAETQRHAWARQDRLCGSCGTPIHRLGAEGRSLHEFGEVAHAHHMRPVRLGGKGSSSNCVILCQTCHYTAHEGGNYRYGTVVGSAEDFPHFDGR